MDISNISFFILLLLVAISVILITTPLGDNTKLVNTVTVLSVLPIVFSIILAIHDHHKSIQSNKVESYKSYVEQNNSYLSIEKLFLQHSDLANLYRQLYPLQPSDDLTVKEEVVCTILLQYIEHVLLSYDMNIAEDDSWFKLFKHWFNSEKLRKTWLRKRHFYSEESRRAIDKLIS